MKIAEISAFCQFSVGKIMNDIKDYINNFTKDECKIFFARGNSKDDDCIKVAKEHEIKVNALISRFLDNDGFCNNTITRRIIKELDEYNPDIIHIHCLHGYYCDSSLLFSYFKNHPDKRVIWTMHDTWAFTGHCCFFNKINCEKWKNQCYKCQLKNEYPKSKLLDNSKKNFIKKKNLFTSLPTKQLKLVTPSNWLKDLMSYSYLNKYEIKTIYNGIDTKKFNLETQNSTFDSNKKILLGVASVWDERKGLNIFNDLAKVISDDWKIIIIGKIAEKIDLDERITHIERTKDQNVLKEYYQKCNLLFNPTLDDNYPTVNLEAQACGSKVLTFNTGGCSETQCGNLYVIDSKLSLNKILDKIYEIDKNDINKIDDEKLSKERMVLEYIKLMEAK